MASNRRLSLMGSHLATAAPVAIDGGPDPVSPDPGAPTRASTRPAAVCAAALGGRTDRRYCCVRRHDDHGREVLPHVAGAPRANPSIPSLPPPPPLFPPPAKPSPGGQGSRNICLVKVECEGGVFGWGEAGLSGRELAVAGAVDHYAQFLVGQVRR